MIEGFKLRALSFKGHQVVGKSGEKRGVRPSQERAARWGKTLSRKE